MFERKFNSIFRAAITGVICRSQSLAVGQPEAGWQREEAECCFLLPAKIYCVSYATAIGVFSPMLKFATQVHRVIQLLARKIQGNACIQLYL